MRLLPSSSYLLEPLKTELSVQFCETENAVRSVEFSPSAKGHTVVERNQDEAR